MSTEPTPSLPPTKVSSSPAPDSTPPDSAPRSPVGTSRVPHPSPSRSPSLPRPAKSLRGKFVRLLLIVSSLMALSTTSIVVLMSAQASSEHFAAVQGHIQDGIISKGKVLTQNHAIALRSLVLDNAFLDIQRLVERAVKDDQDLVYGVFVNGERAALAKSQRGDAVDKSEPPEKDAWKGLGLSEG